MTEEKELNFEKKLNRLEEIVEILDRGEAPLEELLAYFEEGMELSKECREFLEKAELKVIEISKENGMSDIEEEADEEFDEQEEDEVF